MRASEFKAHKCSFSPRYSHSSYSLTTNLLFELQERFYFDWCKKSTLLHAKVLVRYVPTNWRGLYNNYEDLRAGHSQPLEYMGKLRRVLDCRYCPAHNYLSSNLLLLCTSQSCQEQKRRGSTSVTVTKLCGQIEGVAGHWENHDTAHEQRSKESEIFHTKK